VCGKSPEPVPTETVASESPKPAQATATPDTRDSPGRTLAAPNAAFTEFKQQLELYLAVRDKAEGSVPKLSQTSDPRKIAERSALLAAAIQVARKDVKQGAIFTPAVSAEIRRILAADAAARTPAERAHLMAEVPGQPPAVNGLYPTDSPKGPAALASFPAKLLAVLPELPESVEYRFLGHSLVLRDVIANIVVDYLPNVAPARPGGGLE
jgi:hypothetical protein